MRCLSLEGFHHNAFERWNDYYDDVALAEIYGFQLDDGQVQISILDNYIMPPEDTGQ